MLIGVNLFAQVRYSDDGQIENTEILIEKNKKITFPEKPKPVDKTSIPKKSTPSSEPQNFDFKELPLNLPQTDPKIKISSIKEETSASIYSNFVRAGGGNYGTSYLESAISNQKPSNLLYGITGKHFASAFGAIDKQNSGNSSNYIQGFAKLYTKKSFLSLTADYQRKGVYFYGYGNNKPSSKEVIYQAFNEFSVKTQFKSIDTLAKIPYDLKAEYFLLNDKFKAKETELYIYGNTEYQLNDFSKISLSGNVSISNKADSLNISRNLIQLKPLYHYLINDKLTVKGGFNIAFENDTVKSGIAKSFHFYPIINADYQLLEKINIFAGLDGGMEKNTLRTMIHQNPWLSANVPIYHTNRQWELQAGIKGNLSNYIYFKLTPSYANYRYMNFFTHSIGDSSKFSLSYDSKGTQLFKLSTEVVFEKSQAFKIGLKAEYFSYNTSSLSQAWHRPSFEFTSWLTYNLYGKLYFYLDIFYISGIKSYNFTSNKEYSLNDVIDVSLKIDYKLNERFSIFLYGFNLIGQNYQRFNYYPVKGVNVLGGLTFAF
jgi:hypothetical protein